jgi:hypothetical protein
MTYLRQTMVPNYRHLLLFPLDKTEWQGLHNAGVLYFQELAL